MGNNTSRVPFSATEIEVGVANNLIGAAADDGSMTFTDQVVGTVKLKDLLNQEVVINPGVIISVETDDWTAVTEMDGRTFYTVDVPHNFNVSDLSTIDAFLWDEEYKTISIEYVQQKTNTCLLKSILPLSLFVIMKRV